VNGSELRAARRDLSLPKDKVTQATLAKALDVHRNTVSLWERDLLPISRRNAMALRAVFRSIRKRQRRAGTRP
jgi:DNA-binding XRE family transcriptional regulator